MSGLFTINAISKLDSVVDWDIITGVCESGLIDKIVGASALMAFSSLLLIIIKRIFSGQAVDLMSIAREMYVKLLILATIFINPISYKAAAHVYTNVVKSLYENLFKSGIGQVQWSVAYLAEKINESTSMGLLDVLNPVAWTSNILGCLVSVTINLSMLFYWILASMVPIYVTIIILIIPPIMSLSLLFDGMGRKVLMMLISGIMVMFIVGLTMTLLGTELHYYAISEMLQQGNIMIMIMLGSVIIAMVLAIPMIMMYIFDNGIFNAVQIVLTMVSVLTAVSLPVSIKSWLLNKIKNKALAGR